jgi:threonine/homoserine/homoserine lactone efflux protein
MTPDILFALSTFALVSSITPGPNNAMLLASGVNFGLRRTLPHMLGVNFGFPVMALSIGLGLQGVLATVPLLYQIIRWAGAAYLLFLAWKIATADEITEQGAAHQPMSFWQAVAFQWVNPKAWVMAVGAVTAYTTGNSFAELATVCVVFMLLNLPCILAWTAAGVALRRVLDKPIILRAFNITMGVLLVLSLYPLLNDL